MAPTKKDDDANADAEFIISGTCTENNVKRGVNLKNNVSTKPNSSKRDTLDVSSDAIASACSPEWTT